MKNNDYPIYFKSKGMMYMQAMMVYGGSGMEIWNIVKLER